MLEIPYLKDLNAQNIYEASKLLNHQLLQEISCNNWFDNYPYSPHVSFRIAHNNREIFLKYNVEEECTMAKVTQDNGEVWTDSCVEFFIALDDSGYYNFEFTCIGKTLLAFRKEKPNPTHATPEILNTIKRLSTLGEIIFEEKTGDNKWELTVAIPLTTLFKHQVEQLSGLSARINVYKCGDNLSKPHFLSWKPIDTPIPNFHVPQFFHEIRFL